MSAYYNEIDPYAADWLRNLISAGLIPPGEVDTRSIKDVSADDVRGFNQCHFFAGVGGWPFAFRLASIDDDSQIWSGSCPCQPFSAAGKRKGTDDERHLWPEFRRLIAGCRPSIVFGEQVASADGRKWLGGYPSEVGGESEETARQAEYAGVRGDLEALGYGVGAADLCAPGSGEEGEGWIVHLGGVVVRERITLGAPHIRQRLFWGAQRLADSEGTGRRPDVGAIRSGQAERLREEEGKDERRTIKQAGRPCNSSAIGRLDIAASERNRPTADAGSDCESAREGRECCAGGSGSLGELVNSDGARRNARSAERQERGETRLAMPATGSEVCDWSDFAIIPCTDGKSRRTEPRSFPLAHGIPTKRNDPRMGFLLAELAAMGHDPRTARKILRQARRGRTGRLKGYGNAIIAQLATEFVRAFMDTEAT